MIRKVFHYLNLAICHVSAQEILMVLATVLSYTLYGTVANSLYLWLIVVACDLTIIGAHGAYAVTNAAPPAKTYPWRIPTPLILRWISFVLIAISQDGEIITAFAWYMMVFTAVAHAFYCVLLAMNAHSPTWLEGTNGDIGLPNWISISRMALSVIVPHLYAVHPFGAESNLLATTILFVAIITDAADGFVARKLNQCTKAGKALDPLGDKVIFYPTAVAFILATHGTIYLDTSLLRWIFYICFAIMFARDALYIIWFAIYYTKLKDGIGASMIDKVRMATLCAWLGVSALALTVPDIKYRMAISGFIFMLAIAVLSVFSVIIDYKRMRAAIENRPFDEENII